MRTKFLKTLRSLFLKNPIEKAIAIFSALVVWYFSFAPKPVLVTVVKPALVLYAGLNEEKIVVSELTNQVQITLRIKQKELASLPDLQTLVNLSKLPLGKTWVNFSPKDILGTNAEILSIEPAQFFIDLEPIAIKKVPVQVHFEEARKKIYDFFPKTVTLKGPKNVISSLSLIPTRRVMASNAKTPSHLSVYLDLPKWVTSNVQEIQVFLK